MKDDPINHEATDKFGALIMKNVRDKAISKWDKVLAGQMEDRRSMQIQEMLKSLDSQQLEVLSFIIPQIVDSTLFFFLRMLDEERDIEVSIRTQSGTVPSLASASDGLHGDLFFWIPNFSKERYISPNVDE